MATKKTARGRPAAAKRSAEEARAKRQVHAIVLFAVGMFLAALSLIEGDSLWLTLHQTLFGLFGLAAWFIAPLLIYVAVMTTLDKPIGTIGGKVWQTSALIVLLSSAIQIFSYGELTQEGLWDGIKELFQAGIAGDGGGLVSGLVGLPLMAMCGKAGAKFLIVLLIFVFVMIFSGATLIGLYRGAMKPVKRLGDHYVERVQSRPRPAPDETRRRFGAKGAAESEAFTPPPGAAAPPVPGGGRFNVDVPLDEQAPPPRPRGKKKEEPVFPPQDEPAQTSPAPDPFAEGPRGSFARKAIDAPPDAAQDALYSDVRAQGRFSFEWPLTGLYNGPVTSDGLPLEPPPVPPEAEASPEPEPESAPDPLPDGADGEALPDPVAQAGLNTVLHFRPAQPQAPRPQTTDEVIDEILRRALAGAEEEAAQADLAPDFSTGEPLEDVPPFPAPSEEPEPPTGPDAPADEVEQKLWGGLHEAAREAAAPPPPAPPREAAPVWTPSAAGALPPEPQPYAYPPVTLLQEPPRRQTEEGAEELKANAQRLVDTLQSFGVQTRVIDIARGPAVTRYELQPSAGVKISKITSLADDIALNLAAAGVRIEAPIPNKPAVGIEVPNKNVSTVHIREIIDSDEFRSAKSSLSFALGRDISGRVTVADAAKMPHMLIAGATGSGKSVCINSIIMSLLFKSPPDKVKLLMVDPKVVELGIYNGIPHLLVPVVTDPKKAAGALAWAVNEMLGRYKQFADNQVRDIAGFNRLCASRPDLIPMPQMVIIIDELADLMMAAPNDVEDSICRLAQMARAAGMHLIIATQRPSVDVITGVIKANIPSRIAFAVSSTVDSRTILDSGGAEKLLGRGDMLFYPVGAAKPQRVQGCFVTDQEVEAVVDFIKRGSDQADYDEAVMEEIERQAVTEKDKKKGGSSDDGGGFDEEDDMLPAAIECVIEMGMASTSMLQRKLKLGYARAARIVDQLEEKGVVGPFEGSKPRQVLITKEQWYEMKLRQEN